MSIGATLFHSGTTFCSIEEQHCPSWSSWLEPNRKNEPIPFQGPATNAPISLRLTEGARHQRRVFPFTLAQLKVRLALASTLLHGRSWLGATRDMRTSCPRCTPRPRVRQLVWQLASWPCRPWPPDAALPDRVPV